MIRFRSFLPGVAALLVGAAMLCAPAQAAVFQVTIEDVTTSTSQVFNWSGLISGGMETIIVPGATIGNFLVSLEFVQSNTPGA
jgi:hypothetical protein